MKATFQNMPAVSWVSEKDREYVFGLQSWTMPAKPKAKEVVDGLPDTGKTVNRVEIIRTTLEEWSLSEVLDKFSADRNARRPAELTREGGRKLLPVLLTDKTLHRPLEVVTDGDRTRQTAGSQRAEALRIGLTTHPETVRRYFGTLPVIVRVVAAEDYDAAIDQLSSDQDQQPFPLEGIFQRFVLRVRAGEKLESIVNSMLSELVRLTDSRVLKDALNSPDAETRKENVEKWRKTGAGPQLYRFAAETPRLAYWLYCQLAAEEGRGPRPQIKLDLKTLTASPEPGAETMAALVKEGKWLAVADRIRDLIEPAKKTTPTPFSAKQIEGLGKATDAGSQVAYLLTTAPAEGSTPEERESRAVQVQQTREMIEAATELNKQIGYREWSGLPARLAGFVADIESLQGQISDLTRVRSELEAKAAQLTAELTTAAGRKRK